jgi:hypothetical protein
LVNSSLPVVICPTSLAFTPTTSPAQQPTTMTVEVPQNLASQLAVYSDNMGDMKLVAPTGWSCSASYGADGSGGVQVSPPGESLSDTSVASSSTEQAVEGTETSACAGCTEGQACPLFASAASDYATNFQTSCSRPPSESVTPLNANVVSFQDPPGVAGDGKPSGGAYPANGVMTYYPISSGNDNGSYLETCTLPASEQSICTVILDRFVDWYGAD